MNGCLVLKKSQLNAQIVNQEIGKMKKNKIKSAQCPECGRYMDKVIAYICKNKKCRRIPVNLELK